jgi:hypothetical protein
MSEHPVWVKVCDHPGCVITTDHTHGSAVKYQVTVTKPGERMLVIAEFPNGYLATEFATKFSTTRAASGKVVTIRRSDGEPV